MPFTTANTTIKIFRHALSLDEHRAKFQPNLYHRINQLAAATQVEPVVASPTSIMSDETDETMKKPRVSESKQPLSPTMRPPTVKPVGTIYPMGKGDSWQPWPRKRFYSRKKEEYPQDAEAALARKAHHELTADDDPCDDYVGTADVREVWFAGCHSGKFASALLYGHILTSDG